MKLQIKPSLLELRRTKVKFIIIHHTVEVCDIPAARIDTPKFQYPFLVKSVFEKQKADINYNYVVELIKDDYVPIVARPLTSLCQWDNIKPEINKASIHVALLGSYDFKIVERRLYEIMCYRLLSPLLKAFKLPMSRVLLHRDVATDNITCPGDFFDKEVLTSMLRRFLVK